MPLNELVGDISKHLKKTSNDLMLVTIYAVCSLKIFMLPMWKRTGFCHLSPMFSSSTVKL